MEGNSFSVMVNMVAVRIKAFQKGLSHSSGHRPATQIGQTPRGGAITCDHTATQHYLNKDVLVSSGMSISHAARSRSSAIAKYHSKFGCPEFTLFMFKLLVVSATGKYRDICMSLW